MKDGSLKAEMIAEFEHQSQDTDFMARRDEEEHLQAAIRQGSYDTSDLQLMREVSELGEIVVWGHDEVPDAISDSYSKGIEEWIAMAHAVCLSRWRLSHATNSESRCTRPTASSKPPSESSTVWYQQSCKARFGGDKVIDFSSEVQCGHLLR